MQRAKEQELTEEEKILQQQQQQQQQLRRRKTPSSNSETRNGISANSTSDGDSSKEAFHPSSSTTSSGRLPDDYANSVYCKHAEEFPEKFRVSIDYSIQEKPQQVLSSAVVLALVVVFACGPSWLWRDGENYRFFQASFEDFSEERQHELRFRAVQVIGCLAVAIMGYCFLESRDGLLVRPHPGFWRVIHGLCLTYFLCLVALLSVHRDDGRFLVRMLLPGFGSRKGNVFSGTLVLDCSVSMNTLTRQLTSVWFISHAVGWFLKMCIFRSWMFNLTFSILFEFCEMSLQWLIPEFQECWWDSIFIDAIFSNLMGMVVGCAVMRWCGKRHFDWLGAYPRYQKIMLKFTPFSSCEYEWSFFRTPRHLLMTSLLLFLSLLAEVSVFLLMTVLDIPAVHWINPTRLGLLGLLAFPAVAEFYAQLQFRYDRMGGNVFLFVMILTVELLVSIKYGTDRFYSSSPDLDVVLPWVLAGALFGAWCCCYFSHATQERRSKAETHTEKVAPRKHQRENSLRDTAALVLLKLPPQACFLPLLYLAKYYYYGGS
ncbi:phosphatidylserine synthase, putative [Eimeria maxima]|uniref:Phosphatidylserine synthase, putative n=1 Tax=Eimeria maxima TaxID=5804 RepID=U6M7Z3_EIMMA|nr:phosphatidylserine synthase, putative [Eimeria maxima]CDJ58559.1 phosphatidylserine synthase, putative [Eimeria maxima]